MRFSPLFSLLFSSASLASQLYAASYDGKVTELGLSKSGQGYHLNVLSQTDNCGPSPSWLMPDGENGMIYCLDEGIDSPNGTLTSFSTLNGTLAKIDQLKTIAGPVASAFYSAAHAPERQFLVIAHYSGSAVTSYSVNRTTGTFNLSQTFTFAIPKPGPVPDRQDAPHPHGVVVDPTGHFVLVPDLGADLVRIFRINERTGKLSEQRPLVTPPGSGPRHGVFWLPQAQETNRAQAQGSKFYLVSELDNMVSGYDVTYAQNGTMLFSQFYQGSTYGGAAAPSGSKAAEIAIAVRLACFLLLPLRIKQKQSKAKANPCPGSLQPSNDRLLVSNRGDDTFGAGNDSIAVFSIPGSDATSTCSRNVSFTGLYPSHGSFPRHFEFSPDGTMVAIALQNSHSVAVVAWERNGGFGSLLAQAELGGEVTAVVWGVDA
ncbi:uncharacterized protein DSM5745_07279 [Aspergillus mulundensis]|uniref:6-phosphogluconolactonase n=1 Tax=Aspergillus mulundensis TaxID=1810919 RepID=A0A3D8RKN9_9EURO|nr:Uncharacterized protein DSM5745_07279 [Aspergillus mulundensis]RDW74617.1 Uncharacterized protein DSM5745_07279 [Aspergillus mulundensis]